MEAFDFAAATSGADRAPGPPGLDQDLATAARRAGLLLEAMLRRPVDAAAGGLHRIRPADVAVDGVASFSIDPGTGARGVATAPGGFVTALAELCMGGPGDAAGRPPTPLEASVFASRLTAALGPVAAVLPVAALRLAPAAPPGGPATELVAFDLTITAGPVAGTLQLALPAAHFAAAGIAPGPGADPDPALVAALQAVAMPLSVRFGAVRLPGDELERLAVGDVVRLPHPVDRPLVAEVDGQPLFLARPGRRGRRLAVEIADVVEERS